MARIGCSRCPGGLFSERVPANDHSIASEDTYSASAPTFAFTPVHESFTHVIRVEAQFLSLFSVSANNFHGRSDLNHRRPSAAKGVRRNVTFSNRSKELPNLIRISTKNVNQAVWTS